MIEKDDKLTLKLQRAAIAKAKRVAKIRGTSLSRMVEDFFFGIAEPTPAFTERKISPVVMELSGVLRGLKHIDFKKEYGKHLERKYGK